MALSEFTQVLNVAELLMADEPSDRQGKVLVAPDQYFAVDNI
jgi:hypothetical protein